MKSRTPAASPTKHAWLTPPAGPEKIVLIGRRRAVSVVIVPSLDARPVERHQHGTVGSQPLADLEAVLAFDYGLGAHERGHEERRDVALGAADLDQVTKAGGRENGHARATPLQDGVGADGRAVDEPPHVAARDAQRSEP